MIRFYIKTFGRQMNDKDSESLAGLLIDEGFFLVSNPQDADIILVNTCSVRKHAEDRALSFLGRFLIILCRDIYTVKRSETNSNSNISTELFSDFVFNDIYCSLYGCNFGFGIYLDNFLIKIY